MATNNRARSNKRNIEYEKLEEDEQIVKFLLQDSQSFEARLAYMKLLGLIKALKEQI